MKFLNIGKIVNVHGIRGEVKVYPYTDDIDNLSKLKEVHIAETEDAKLNIKLCRVQKNMLLVKFEGIDTVEKAEKLRGKYIYIKKDSLEKLEEGSYYIDDLIGMDVIDALNNTSLGKLAYVFNTGANDIYEVETLNGKKVYLPAIKQVIKKVDLENKKMYVELMEGLI